VTSLARAERTALLELLHDTGPDAPTLCAGWTTHDLAAHLVARERQPAALPGLVVPLLHPLTAALERRARRTPYDVLLEQLRSGPPRWSPMGVPWLEDAQHLHEFYVHHEDVRRLAEPDRPRPRSRQLDDALWSRLRLLGRLLVGRAAGVGVVAVTPDARSQRLGSGDQDVIVRGTPGELLLWAFGRRSVAEVTFDGAPEAVERLRSARVGP
jgi:uncharacterized protein (TIGR03085 family)